MMPQEILRKNKILNREKMFKLLLEIMRYWDISVSDIKEKNENKGEAL